MIELTLLNYLKDKLDYPVYMEVPDAKDMPSQFYVIEKTGSGEDNHIYSATFAIQSYAETMLEAAHMNYQIIEKMREFDTLDEISRCKLSTDYPFANVSVKRYRYQAVFNIIHF